MNTTRPSQDPIDLLREFLRFPSVSTQPEHAPDLLACAEWLSELLSASGLTAAVHTTQGSPVVLARIVDEAGGEVKRIHGALGVRNGMQAAMLAKVGLTGPLTVFEGRHGFFAAFVG